MRRVFVGLAILAAILAAWWAWRPREVSVKWREMPEFTKQAARP